MNIPLVDLKIQYQKLKKEIDKNIAEVCASASFILGPQVEEFERSFAEFLEADYVVGVANATDALHLAFAALGLGVNDEVIIPANTFVATAVGVMETGARPVLVDMDPETYLIDLKKIESAITSRTKAICPVHLYGRACNMDVIAKIAQKHSLFIVEDVAQAAGARWKKKRVGTFGQFGCFSFYPGKNLGAYGDGGAMSASSEKLAKKIRSMRNFGSEKKYEYPQRGINSRLDSIQAAVLNVKLKYLDQWNLKRWEIAKKYSQELKPLEKKGILKLPDIVNPETHVFHLFVVQVDRRSKVIEFLSKNGIQAGIHYPIPFYLQKGYAQLGYSKGAFPETESASEKILSLPVYPEMTSSQIAYITGTLKKAF
ncbi:MAG TPA: DegT/DnrJ/EryC1/StrS family aminotransferase [Candidatus Omnitrophota bacterium]|nr:DegT/DnrJ/EryC1/StrS family aminotransferase [Candidatus Omnitrophota bacterium]HPD84873.1 DegT/DnrJ/EryC1/StrS family aminotransferase [Candidatus Omnitrophota bacterium]HRZ03731.1 DegT/DnrJ/EryC1/StrS family aminotransferase [Candidatus Omnitrophota bacterium]